MKIEEVTGPRMRQQFPMINLPAGKLLYHGTDTAGDFLIPDGPAWFTLSAKSAQKWIGWSGEPPTGREKGVGRVIVVRVLRDVPLVDTRSVRVWRAFCDALTGDPEVGGGWMALAVKKAGYNGWLGNHEILLTNPRKHVQPVNAA